MISVIFVSSFVDVNMQDQEAQGKSVGKITLCVYQQSLASHDSACRKNPSRLSKKRNYVLEFYAWYLPQWSQEGYVRDVWMFALDLSEEASPSVWITRVAQM